MTIEREGHTGKYFRRAAPKHNELATRASSSSPHEEHFPFFTEADSTILK